MPSFTEAAMTLRARALGLDPTAEYVLAHPAIYPFTLFNQAFSASGTLGGVGCVGLLFRSAAQLVLLWWNSAGQAPRRAVYSTVPKVGSLAGGHLSLEA